MVVIEYMISLSMQACVIPFIWDPVKYVKFFKRAWNKP